MATLISEVGFRANVEDNGASATFEKIADAARQVPPAMKGAADSLKAVGGAATETGVKVDETTRTILKSVPGVQQLNRQLDENAKYAANCATINGKYQHTLDGIAAAVARGLKTEAEAEEMRRRADIKREHAMALAERQRDAMAKSFAADPSVAAAAGQAQYAVALEGVLRQYDKMHGANARYAEETARVTAILDAANATEKQRATVLRGVAEAYDPVTRAALEAAEAAEREAAARQKVIAAAKAQAAAEDAQRRYNADYGVRPVAAGSAAASASVFMEAEENARALENLRRKYDATYAAEARHKDEVAHVVAVTKAANVSDAERAALLAKVEEAHAGAARGAAARGQALRLLVPQLNDVFVTAAMGMNPLMIAIQQGPQIIDAFVLGGKEAGAEMLRLAATAAPIALLVGTIAALAAAQESYAGALRETARVNTLTGGSSGFSDAGLEAQAVAAAKAAHTSIASARDVQNAYVATGQIGGRVLSELTAMTRDYAVATKQDMGAAAQELAGMFSDPGRAAEDAAKRWKIFDDAQVRVIKNLQAQGRLEEAQMRLLDGIGGRVQGAAEKVSIYAKAWHDVETAVSDAWTALGKGLEGDDPGIAALKQRYEALLAAKGKPSLEFGFFGPRQSDIDGAGKEYGAAFRNAEADSWFAAKAKGDADFKDLQSRAMAFVRGMTPAIALADDFANAQNLMNRAVAAGAISSDLAAQALRAYELQVQQTIDPSKTLVDAINQETQALNLQAGAARNAWTALQQLQRQQPGREIGFDQAAGVQQGVAERSDAQSADRARQVDVLAAAERRLNQARIAGNPREVARATVDLGIAQKQAAGEAVNAAEKAALHAQAQRGATAEIESQVHQLGLQVDAAERAAAAAGKGEAAQRRAAIETQVAAASLKGLGLETRMALEMQEAYVAAGIHAEFAGQIDQEAAANERLVAAMGQGVAAYRDAEIHNKAVAQALKETPPEYDAAGHAAGRFSEAISANIALLKKQQGAADSVDLGKYVEKLKDARKDLDFRGSTAGMSSEAKAVAKAQYDTAEALRRQYGEYEKLGPAQQRQWDTAVKLAEENARIEEGVKRQEDAWNQLGQIGERAFDRIGDAVTQLFLEGKNKAISWGSLMKSVAASVAADIAKMGVNDLKRMVGLGGSGGGLSDLFGGAAQSNGQAAVQGQFGGLSVSGLGNLFSGTGSSIWGDSGSLSGYLFGNAGDPLMTGLSNSGLIGSGGGIGGVPIGQIAGGIGGALGLYSAFRQFSAGNVLGGVGSAIGGGLGLMSAFAPATFAALGPLGPIAMVAAPILGSLFGKGKAPTPSAAANIMLDDSGDVVQSGTSSRAGADATPGVQAAQAAMQAVRSLKSLGAEWDRFSVDVHVDKAQNLRTFLNGFNGPEISGEKDPDKIAVAVVKYLATHKLDGGNSVSADEGTLRFDNERVRTAALNSKAETVAGLTADLAFAKNFDQTIKALAGSLGFEDQAATQAAKTAEALADQIAAFHEKTADLGLPLAEAEKATRAYIDALIKNGDSKTYTAVEASVASLKAQWEAMGPALEAVGYSADQAKLKIGEGLANAMANLRQDIGDSFDARLNDAKNQGYRNQISALMEQRDIDVRDLTAAGMDVGKAGVQFGAALDAVLQGLDPAALSIVIGNFTGAVADAATAIRTIKIQTTTDAGAATLEKAINPAWAQPLEALFRSLNLVNEPIYELMSGIDGASLSAVAARNTLSQLDAALAAGTLTIEQYGGLVDRLTQAYGKAAAAIAASLKHAQAAGDLAQRRAVLSGDQVVASMLRFDLDAAQQIRAANDNGYDAGALRVVLAAERARTYFDATKSDYLLAIDREIEARQLSTQALQEGAMRAVQMAKSFQAAASELKLSDKSDLTPGQRLEEVRTRFEDAVSEYRAANDNDAKAAAAAKIQDLGDRRVEIGYGYFASTDFSDYRRVLAIFEEFSIAQDVGASTAEETIKQNNEIIKQLTEQRRSAERLGERQLASLDALKGVMDGAKQALDIQLSAVKAAPVTTVDSLPDAILRAAAAQSGHNFTGQFKDGEFAGYAIRETAGSKQNFGAWDTTQGQYIARGLNVLTGYTGDYADGKFVEWIKGQETLKQEAARELLRRGGFEPQFAEGGLVTGGTPGVDSVRAWLMPGERVLSVPHSAMLERIYAMAAMTTPPANDPMPPRVVALQPPPVAQPSPPELAELVKLLRELIALIGAAQAKALAQSGAIGGATLEKFEELIREIEEQNYQTRKAG